MLGLRGVFVTGLTLLTAVISAPTAAETNMLFILDGSNSMWGQVNASSKIEMAKSVLGDMLKDLPLDTKIGLMAYGHRAAGDCKDVELLSGIGADSMAGLLDKITNITPTGKTPIAASLGQAEFAFDGRLEENNNVILISDGIETCEGDPCAVAAGLIRKGLNVRVHVVGFDVDADARAQLQCIADAGEGLYFDAQSAQELSAAVTEVKIVAASAPEPEPEPAGPIEVFRDDFDGEELGEVWEISNPDPDAFIIENGELLVVSGTRGSLSEGNVGNLFRLTEPLPKGDWTLTAKFSGEFQTGKERVFISLFEDNENYLEIGLQAFFSVRGGVDAYATFDVAGVKRSKGEDKMTGRRLWDGEWLGDFRSPGPFANGIKEFPQPVLLRLQKQGRNYIGGAMLEGNEEPTWIDLDKFTILRQKGAVAVGLYQVDEVPGEGLILLDWVKIETP